MSPHGVKARLKGIIRRQVSQFLPSADAREYRAWMKRHLALRRARFPELAEPGLLSIITAVWDGSPVEHLKNLARSIQIGNPSGACEWVVLDNGVVNERLSATLSELQKFSWVKLLRSEKNVGIIHGLRLCLEHASGRYVLPVDGDDRLYPDALCVVSHWIVDAGFPALLYTDEDKIIGHRIFDPYLKPDWDPVLLLNSAYVAHLGVLGRETALDLNVYSDASVEGSPDWDAFVRFLSAGYSAVHIPEIVYSWRVHQSSTAYDTTAKPYIHSSQKAVLQRFIDSRVDARDFKVESSPLFGNGAHFYIRRKRDGSGLSFQSVTLKFDDSIGTLLQILSDSSTPDSHLFLTGTDLAVIDSDWSGEVRDLFALHSDTVMVGGRIWNEREEIVEAGQVFGLSGMVGCPFAGRKISDPGYFGQLWKRRSVSAVSAQMAIVDAQFLRCTAPQLPRTTSVALLGAWLGAAALRSGKRVIYTPYLAGRSESSWLALVPPAELALFRESNRDLIPDCRYYPRYFSLSSPFKFEWHQP